MRRSNTKLKHKSLHVNQNKKVAVTVFYSYFFQKHKPFVMDVTNVKARSITTSEDSTNERGKQQQGNIKNTFLSPIIAIKSSKMKIN